MIEGPDPELESAKSRSPSPHVGSGVDSLDPQVVTGGITARVSLVPTQSGGIFVCRGNLAEIPSDAVVSPSNTFLVMRGGVSSVLRERAGQADRLEQAAVARAPIAIGDAVLTPGFDLPARYVIHAPTVESPVDCATPTAVVLATRAALRVANHHRLRHVALPSLGTGTGGISYSAAVDAMMPELAHSLLTGERTVESVTLVAFENEFLDALTSYRAKTAGVALVRPPPASRPYRVIGQWI